MELSTGTFFEEAQEVDALDDIVNVASRTEQDTPSSPEGAYRVASHLLRGLDRPIP
jgi:hypothetical protein